MTRTSQETSRVLVRTFFGIGLAIGTGRGRTGRRRHSRGHRRSDVHRGRQLGGQIVDRAMTGAGRSGAFAVVVADR